jgi:RNA ligase (TIGR02306 family)
MSTHRVEVLRLGAIEKHPKADSLGLARVSGFTCCVRLGEFKEGDLVAYIEPDMLVDSSRPGFEFLKGSERIRVRRLRGIISQGLIVRAPEGAEPGEDVMTRLGVKRYEPPLQCAGGESEAPPLGRWVPSYDVENWRRHGDLFREGEAVLVTEKIHGANARFCWHDGRLYCGSRNEWKSPDTSNPWWLAARQNPWIEDFCRANPLVTLFGEVFGRVQDLHYGLAPGEFGIRLFDALVGNEWLSWSDLPCRFPSLIERWVPILFEGAYSRALMEELAEGRSTIPGAAHIREGVVVQPTRERREESVGRLKLKIVSNAYLGS